MREYCLMVHGDEIKEKNITGYSIRKASGTMEGLPAHNIKIRKGNSVAEALLWQGNDYTAELYIGDDHIRVTALPVIMNNCGCNKCQRDDIVTSWELARTPDDALIYIKEIW